MKLLVRFDPSWALFDWDGDKRAVDTLLEHLRTRFADTQILSSGTNECTVILPGEDVERLCADVKSILLDDMKLKKTEGIVTMAVLDRGPVKPPVKPAEKPQEKPQEKPAEKPRQEPEAQPEQPAEQPSAQERIRALMGCADLQQLAEELLTFARGMTEKSRVAFLTQTYLFSIGAGYEYADKLALFADLLHETGLCPEESKPRVLELTLPAAPDALAAEKIIEKVRSDLEYKLHPSRIISIDISAWMDKTSGALFKQLLFFLDARVKDRGVIIFRVPFVKEETLSQLGDDISDILFLRTVRFSPLTDEQLRVFANQRIEESGLTMTDDAWGVFQEKLVEERSDGAFYGLRTARKLVHEIVYHKALADAAAAVVSPVVEREHIASLLKKPREQEAQDGMAMLDELVGMEPIKAQIQEILSSYMLSTQVQGLGRPCLHMRFVGSPGTGKTTVARILGAILKQHGILRVGRFFECRGRDLCGQYVGETALKTSAICKNAYGSVLFIDEAYALFRGEFNSRDYGREAIDTLIAEMENHRDDMVVIMAGYTKDMETLMESNTGMRSRMPYVITFPNYDRAQLAEIFFRMSGKCFTLTEAFRAAATAYFDAIPTEVLESDSFGNARFVRNLYERLCAKVSLRLLSDDVPQQIELSAEDFHRAVESLGFKPEPKKNPIGF